MYHFRLGKTALITGASSDIGYELAKWFAAVGANLVLVARGQAHLNQIAPKLESAFKASAKVIAADLSRPVAPGEIYRETGPVSWTRYLVNNAGFGASGAFVETELQTELDMMRVNLVSLVYLTKLYLAGMRSRGSGGILNVASSALSSPPC